MASPLCLNNKLCAHYTGTYDDRRGAAVDS